jgi:methionine-rich copper-binding protein CopC
MLRLLRAAGVGIVALTATTLPAFAHAHLLSSTPAAGSWVPIGLASLILHFSERVEPGFTGIKLEDSAGHITPTGAATSDALDPSTIVVPVPEKLAAGHYEVAWHALAVDGHKTNGSYDFTVTP